MSEETEAQEDLPLAPGLLLPYPRCVRRKSRWPWEAYLTFRVQPLTWSQIGSQFTGVWPGDISYMIPKFLIQNMA